jgi:hypothetical protein
MEYNVKGLPLGQLLTMFAVVIAIFGLFKSGFIGGPRD